MNNNDKTTDKDKNFEQENGISQEAFQEIEKLKNQILYITSDFQNYKRRVEKERLEWIFLAKTSVVKSFLPIIDDMQRALDSCKKEALDEKENKRLEGFELIYKNLNKILSDLEITEIDCTGIFDPEKHEALMQVEKENFASGQIVEVFVKGYMLGDKVLRHAKVSVAK